MRKHSFHMGMMFRRDYPPGWIQNYVQFVEQAGFDELWVVEDCFFTSGVASAATALACPSRLSIGLGIMPAAARNPAVTAMEIATLAQLYPGRFLPGLGHGIPAWMKQIGALPKSPVKALEEVAQTIRALLHGETVTYDGQYVHLDQVRLEYPPGSVPPISLGVRGPKSLTMSGRVADGTIVPECSSPAYIAWARQRIAEGQTNDTHHRLTVYAFCEVAEEGQAARNRLRPAIAACIADSAYQSQLLPTGIVPQINELLANGGQAYLEAEMPDEWISQLSVVGTPSECVAAIHALVDVGVDSVVFIPPYQGWEQWLTMLGDKIIPAL